MLIAKNDEAKRSRIWSRGMVISSVIIVFVAVYLLIKVMNENPVAGEWMDDDGNYAINILNNGKLYVTDFTEEELKNCIERAYDEACEKARREKNKAMDNLRTKNPRGYDRDHWS